MKPNQSRRLFLSGAAGASFGFGNAALGPFGFGNVASGRGLVMLPPKFPLGNRYFLIRAGEVPECLISQPTSNVIIVSFT